MVDAVGKPKVSGKETGGGSRAAHVLGSLGQGHPSAQAPNENGFVCLIHLRLKAQVLYAFQKMPGIVGKQYTSEAGGPVCQRSQKQGAVGDALGAWDVRGNRSGDSGFFALQGIIQKRNGVSSFGYHKLVLLLRIRPKRYHGGLFLLLSLPYFIPMVKKICGCRKANAACGQAFLYVLTETTAICRRIPNP